MNTPSRTPAALAAAALLCLFGPAAPAGAAEEPVMRTAAELTAYRYGRPSPPRRYALEGTITKAAKLCLIIEDSSGATRIANVLPTTPRAGDRVKMHGWAEFNDHGNVTTFREAEAAIVGHEAPPPPRRLALADADDDANDLRLVEVEGVLVDSFRDDIDPSNDILILRDGAATMPVSAGSGQHGITAESLGARLRVTGILARQPLGLRKVPGPMIAADESASSVEVVSPAPADKFNYPALTYDALHTPKELAKLDKRTTTGTVLAVWHDSNFLIRVDDGRHVSSVELVRGVAPPKCGAHVQVVGYPATDLYNLNLTHGMFRELAAPPAGLRQDTPVLVDAETLLTDMQGRRRLDMSYHGRLVTLRGTIRGTRPPAKASTDFVIDCGHFLVPVDTGASGMSPDDLPPGCEVEVTGICLMTGDNWREDRPFPRHDGFSIVMRTPADVRVVANPPWWTRGRMLAVIVGLALAIVACAVWNHSLNHLAAKRGSELFREQIEHASANLRVEERTRLAVELHDSLSQNLEGIAYLLAAGQGKVDSQPEYVKRNLATAERMLNSSRTELKRCLFDLRHDALEEQDFSAAIRKSCEPLAGDAKMSIRFNVDRSRLTDTTAHAVLCIIRELVSNAATHGHAGHVYIAGDYRDGVLRFSVRDDGAGFDPATCRGPADGHFGLAGIRARVKRLGGVLELESSAGGPTRAAVSATITRPESDMAP